MVNALQGLGIIEKPKPLISFRVIIDENLSLIKYVLKKYRNSKQFNLIGEIQSKSYFDLIFSIYSCDSKNPLHLLGTDYDFLDKVYAEIMDPNAVYLYKILANGTSTEMFNVVQDFKKSGDILPKILCYNEAELSMVEELEPIKGLGILIDDVNINNFTQVYVEYIEDILPFINTINTTYYISSKPYNFDNTQERFRSDFDNEEINKLIRSGSHISIFDMYNFDLFKDCDSYIKYKERINKA